LINNNHGIKIYQQKVAYSVIFCYNINERKLLKKNMEKINWPKLLGSLIITFGVSWIGSIITRPQIASWYQYLKKTPLTPPSWIFAPVWTILFLMMAIAFYLIWSENNKRGTRRTARVLFYLQLLCNTLWSLTFFALHRIGLAILVITILIVAIVSCLRSFYFLNKKAGWLLLPYLVWTCYAAIINISFFLVN